jgi:plasmid stabilization system protein ParE
VKRRLILRPAAETELADAAAWYEAKRPGLGDQFLDAVDSALSTIADAPTTWPYWKPPQPYRKYVLARFPYVVFFTVDAEAVTIVAIAHGKRRPGYWAR